MRALLLLALLSAAPAPSGVVRFQWRADPDVAFYLVSRAGSTEWVEVVRVVNSPDAPEFNPATGLFTFESPVDSDPGRWRLTAVDAIGNASPPVYLVPEPEPAPPPPDGCTWRPPLSWRPLSPARPLAVRVSCGQACDCGVVTRRLDEARADILSVIGSAEGRLLDRALAGVVVEIVGPEQLVTPSGQQAAGYAGEGRLLLARDLRAAAHEMHHLYLTEAGVPGAQHHDRWATDKRLRDIDAKHGVGGWTR